MSASARGFPGTSDESNSMIPVDSIVPTDGTVSEDSIVPTDGTVSENSIVAADGTVSENSIVAADAIVPTETTVPEGFIEAEWLKSNSSSVALHSIPSESSPRNLLFLIFNSPGSTAPIMAQGTIIPSRTLGAPHTIESN